VLIFCWALKKSELYSSLWQSCDTLRGGMDASQYNIVPMVSGSSERTSIFVDREVESRTWDRCSTGARSAHEDEMG
jgi:hypothetical protein